MTNSQEHITPDSKSPEKFSKTTDSKLSKIFESNPASSPFRYFICIDFEATCDGEIVIRDGKKSFRSSRTKGQFWQNEILSFPVVIVDLKTRTVCDEFHTFIRPTINPILTDYCKQLTGIAQWQIDESPTFSEGLKKFEEYFGDQLTADNTLLVSDSSYDFTGFFRKQCLMSNINFPIWAQRWVNLKRLFVEFYGMQANEKQLPSLRNMVEMAGLKFEGKLHSGMDDVNNMAKLLLRMTADGLSGIMPNEVLDLSLGPPYYKVFQGKTIDKEARRLEKLLTGGADQNTFAAKIKNQPNKPKPRKVQLITKSSVPVDPVKTFAQKVSEKLVKLPNAVQNLGETSPLEEKSETIKKGEIVSTKVPESTPEKSSMDNIKLENNKLVNKIDENLVETLAKLDIKEKTEPKSQTDTDLPKPVIRKRFSMLNIGVNVLSDNDENEKYENLVKNIKLRLSNFVATKSTPEEPLPDFFNEPGLSLQDVGLVLKMSKGFLPKINVVRPKYRKPDNNQPEEGQRKSEHQKSAGTIANGKRRSHGGGKKVEHGKKGEKSTRSPKRSPKQKENERPKSKFGKNNKTGKKVDGKPAPIVAEKKTENGESAEKSTPVLSEIAAN